LERDREIDDTLRYKMHRSRKPSRVSLPQSVRVSLNVIR